MRRPPILEEVTLEMTFRPMYELTITCPKCGDDIEVEFHELPVRYTFAPITDGCDACGYNNEQVLTQLAWDANDVAAEKQQMERLADA